MSHSPTCALLDDHPSHDADSSPSTESLPGAAIDPIEGVARPIARGQRSRRWWTRWDVPEMRWALTATALFATAVAAQTLSAPGLFVGALYAACYVTGGWEQALAGVRALFARSLDVDLLMIVAAVGAAAIGQVFDGALLVVIFATSGALEAAATRRTQDSVRALLDLAPEQATRVTPAGEEELVDVAVLAVGDIVFVRPGERIGADGRVLDGASDVDQATITGEPMPVDKTVGDEVFAGTLNGGGALRVRVDRPPADSVVARIVALVEEASATKAPTQLFIERVEERYSIVVVVATVLLFTVPFAFGADLRTTLLRAMTLMIVASPCALMLATMPPLLSAIANAGRHGVLVKSAGVMERLGTIDVVAFDKTGTLTEGVPRVAAVHALTAAGFDEPDVLRLAAAAEVPSEHPLGRAIVAAARDRDLGLPEATTFSARPGRGITATIGDDVVTVASPAVLDDLPAVPPDILDVVDAIQAAGATAVVVLVENRPIGALSLTDRLRPGAAATVERLRRITSHEPVLLTGDNPGAARAVATDAGVTHLRAGLLPHDKVAAVRELQAQGRRVLLVGDGINDAPALASADVGVAMGHVGADLSLETADAVIVRDDLATLPAVVELSRHARRVVTQNLVIAGTVIAALVAWDLFGHLPLPLGVAGHEGSTLIVGLNGLRLLRSRAWSAATPALTGEPSATSGPMATGR